MTRRHEAGDEFQVDGFHFRVRHGQKCDGDLVLELLNGDEWVRLSFALPFVVMDVLGENEDHLYDHGEGSNYLRRELLTARRDGWRAAWAQLQIDRQHAAEKRRMFAPSGASRVQQNRRNRVA